MTPSPTRLSIPRELYEQARAHAASTYPAECCGVMLGTVTRFEHTVHEVHAAENAREAENQHNRYLIPPQTIARLLHDASKKGLDIVGYYHSHPDHPCKPSVFDREHAWPNTSYLIFSVLEGTPDESRSWRLREDRSDFDEETIHHAASSPAHLPPEAAPETQEKDA